MVVLVLDNLGEILFCTKIFRDLEGFDITLEILGGYAIPVWYTTKFHSIEVRIYNGIVEIGAF